MKFANGDEFVGEWSKNSMKKGKLTKANGTIYDGKFLNGIKHGKGEEKTGKRTLKGKWRNGKKHGAFEKEEEIKAYQDKKGNYRVEPSMT